MGGCVFCQIVAGTSPATIVATDPDTIAFRPLSPVNSGHLLVVPRDHVASAIENVDVTLATMRMATALAAACDSANILTSIGAAATQSVFHLHIHVVPRWPDDGLMLPWGTLHGENPADPHLCRELRDLGRVWNDGPRDDPEARVGAVFGARMDKVGDRAAKWDADREATR